MEDNFKIVEYGQSKNHYAVLVEKALMKNPETGEWNECVIYRQYKNINPNGEYVPVDPAKAMIFVREYNDFWKKFSLCLDL